MQIIPVLDLKAGVVVHGVGGRRSEYRPIVSRLTPSADPLSVALAFRDQFGLMELYVADLDAIAGVPPALAVFRTLQANGFALCVDAGLRHAGDADVLITAGVNTVVAGLETLAGPQELARLCARHGNRVLFSLDLKCGQTLAAAADWQNATAWDVARQAVDAGARRILVLDLARVGGGAGTGTEDLCARLVTTFPEVAMIAGGGVSGVTDLQRLAAIGVKGVLVASALHDGRLTPEELRDGWRGL